MCGIAGIFSHGARAVYPREIEAMCEAMRHRGPDDAGYYLHERAGLGMRRLSIIDLKTGHQPVRNEDGSIHVVLNGEIYNYRELRADLERQGHRFYTATDTETLVHLYEEYGESCVSRLRGMYSFAIWDEHRMTLFLARDRLGIKPLYYTETGGRLIFASELKALLQLPEVPRDLNWGAVNHLFTSLSTPGTESIIKGVHKLPPGHTLSLRIDGHRRLSRYWDVSFEPDREHGEEYFAERLRELMEESVELHLVSDVPLGAFLSGGLDSSSVVAFMAHRSERPVKTFSIGFEESRYDESASARRVARQFGTEHTELILKPGIEDLVECIAWHLDEPFGDSSAIPTYMVSKLAAEEVKVVLSGDGGDELFAGYDKYRVESRERLYEYVPGPLRRVLGLVGKALPEGAKGRNFLRHIALSGPERYLDASTLFKGDQRSRLFRPEPAALMAADDPWRDARMFLQSADADWLSAVQHWDLQSYLPLDILTKVDRMSMAHSLEARVPLLDHKLVEFAATIPPELRLRDGESKSIFKRAMRGILPDEIIDKPKHGFAAPLGLWFRGHLSGFVRELLLSDTSRRREIFDTRYIEQLLAIHERGRDLGLQLWTLISFELWCRSFLDAPPGRRPTPATTVVPAAVGV
ncbi:MAG: asparagine synthase (glutamine-hydrolyzing) [Bacillota bacterium]